VKHKDAQPSSTSSTPTSTQGSETTKIITATPTGDSEGGRSNVGGIVAGVVVGIILAAAAVGGAAFYLRRKRNRELEEEHRRNAAVNAFIGKPGSSAGSMTDSRLDPIMVQRRLSDGSIADNQDYSRRILRVCLHPHSYHQG
jgi:cell wall integrity and stress response component